MNRVTLEEKLWVLTSVAILQCMAYAKTDKDCHGIILHFKRMCLTDCQGVF